MSNSSLVNYTKISPNRTSPRNHTIDTITIHCVVGQVTVERLGDIFAPTSRQASSNYGIGLDGKIGMYVEEKDRSWCSSNASNDHRAITIECASDTEYPYAINDKVYSSLIKLCADICKRNNIKELKWKADKSLIGQPDKQNMTVHRWFAAKSCPGDYIYCRLEQIANEVNTLLGMTNNTNIKTEQDIPKTNSNMDKPELPFLVRVTVPDLNIRSTPGISENNVIGQTGIGVFTIVEMSNGWGLLKSYQDRRNGWIYLDNPEYCTFEELVSESKSDPVNKTEEVPFLVKVKIPDLEIRKGPGNYYNFTGNYTGIGVFTIVEISNGWGLLKSYQKNRDGWVSLSNVTKL